MVVTAGGLRMAGNPIKLGAFPDPPTRRPAPDLDADGARDRGRVERPEPPAQLERRREGALERHLLVEREPDEERERLAREQLVRLVVAGEVEPVGLRRRHETRS
jgi:hypothetical protein